MLLFGLMILISVALTTKAEDDSAQKLKRGVVDTNSPVYSKQYLQKQPSSAPQQEYIYVQPEAAATGREQQYTIVPQGKVLPATQEYQQQYYQQIAAQYQQQQQEHPVQEQPQQQYYQPQPQPAQPKYATVQLPRTQKIAYSSPPRPSHHIPYSSAAEVSSFSYTSPVVSYNSRGLLEQLAGKAPAGTAQAATYSQPSKVQYISVPRTKIVPSAYTGGKSSTPSAAAYSQGAKEYSYSQAAPSTYTQRAREYASPSGDAKEYAAYLQSLKDYQTAAPTYSQPDPSRHTQASYPAPAAPGLDEINGAYQQAPQKVTYERPQQAQAITYQSSPVDQRVNFVPSPAAYQTQKSAPQPVQYEGTAPQTFENADHSAPRVVYVQPQSQRQYYLVPSQKTVQYEQ